MGDYQGETPVFGGLLPSQIEALGSPICGGVVDLHPYHGWVYVSGTHIINHLNMVFGFDGWSGEIKRLDIEPPQKDQKGKWRCQALVLYRITVATPGGRTIVREGIGAAEHTSSNLIDVYDHAPASALTYALRNAAITFGQQFGLAVMRLRVRDDQGKVIDWRRWAAEHPPRWPDFVTSSGAALVNLGDGTAYHGHSGVVVDLPNDSCRVSDDQGATPEDARSPSERRAPAAASRKAPERDNPPQRAPEAPLVYLGPIGNASAQDAPAEPKPDYKPDPSTADQPDPAPAGQGGDSLTDDERAAIVNECRVMWRSIGNEVAKPAFDELAVKSGLPGLKMHLINRSTGDEKCAPDSFVVALAARLKEIERAGAGA